MTPFDHAFVLVLEHEGGLVDDPRDSGGLTKFGISQRAYPNEDIRNLTVARARTLYYHDYWQKCHCDEFPEPLAVCLFDAAVNQGPGTAVRTLQRALDLNPDGIVGKETLDAARGADALIRFQAERILNYAVLRTFPIYGRGWMRRLLKTTVESGK